jgi:phospholipase C
VSQPFIPREKQLAARSFDNVLGWLYADESNRPPQNIPAADPPTFDGLVEKGFSNFIRYKGPPVYAKKGVTKPIKNPDEDYPSFLEQMFGFDPKYLFGSGKVVGLKVNMKGFLESYAKVDAKAPERIMESYSPDQLPIISQLAKQFAVCDRWFSPLPSETWPTRSFLHAGTSFGRLNNGDKLYEHGDPVPNLTFYSGKRTVFDVLSERGVSWKVYQHSVIVDNPHPLKPILSGLNPSLTSTQFWNIIEKIKRIGNKASFVEFQLAAKAGNLPAYSFIEPSFLPPTSDQHPGPFCDMAAGELLIYQTYLALSQGPRWNNTLLIILYDEHGGCYDHVPPPATAVPPDDSRAQFPINGFSPFQQFGPRVPAVVVSPFIEPGTVFRAPQGSTEYDHTSVLATIRDWLKALGKFDPKGWLSSKRIDAAPTIWPILTRMTPRQAPRLEFRKPVMQDAESASPELLQSDDPALASDVDKMTALQLGLLIEAQALQSAKNITDTPEELDATAWQKLIDEATAYYLGGGSTTGSVNHRQLPG